MSKRVLSGCDPGQYTQYDILCSNIEGTRFVHIQVKTFIPGGRTCSVGMKAERSYGDNFFWVLGGIPAPDSLDKFEYFVIPSAVMAKNISEAHQKWMDTPGKDGKEHQESMVRIVTLPPRTGFNGWDVTEYRNRWDLIAEKLL